MRKTNRSESVPVTTVVLVHGAWFDGSSWNEVIARLQAKHVRVVSAQIPLTSLKEDVEVVERIVAREANAVVLVGHDWGGTVITQAGKAENVAGLVFVAGFAPEPCQSTNDLQRAHAANGPSALLETDPEGFLWFPQDRMCRWVAHDLPAPNATVLAATQRPIRASAFDERVSTAAWQSKRSWYLVAEQDRMIPAALQYEMAKRMQARTTAVAASHVPFLSRPRETTVVIQTAIDSLGAL